MKQRRVKFSVIVDSELYDWLKESSLRMAYMPAPGRRPGETLGPYVAEILAAHRKGRPAVIEVTPEGLDRETIRGLQRLPLQLLSSILELAGVASVDERVAALVLALGDLATDRRRGKARRKDQAPPASGKG